MTVLVTEIVYSLCRYQLGLEIQADRYGGEVFVN